MDAAERLIFVQGADNTSMDEIAEAAELSKGLLYFYFKSKEDLLHSIVHRGLGILGGLFRDALKANDKGIEQARAVAEAYIRFSEKNADYFALMSWFETQRVSDPVPGTYSYECEEESEHVLSLIAQSIANGIGDGTIRSDLDPNETAIVLWGMTHGVITVAGQKRHDHAPRLEPALLLNATLDFMSRGLAPAVKREKLLS